MQIQKICAQTPLKNDNFPNRKNKQTSFSGDFVFLEKELGQKMSKNPELRKVIDSFQSLIENFTDDKLGVVVGLMPKNEAKLVNASTAENPFARVAEDLKIEYHDYKTNETKTSGFYLNPTESENSNRANLWQNLIDHAKDHIEWERLFNR